MTNVGMSGLPLKARGLLGKPVPWFWTYEECRRHQRHPSRKIARQEMRRHTQMVGHGMKCWKCRQKRLPIAFRCPQSPDHYHWGHGDVVEETDQ